MTDTQEPANQSADELNAEPIEVASAKASWWRAVPLWARIVFPSLGGALVVALVVTLIVVAMPHSKNGQACKDFEKAYNAFAVSVKAKFGADVVRLQASNLADAINDAHAESVGEVRSDLTLAGQMSDGFLSGDADMGTAFFMATSSVADACKADGAAIDLIKLG